MNIHDIAADALRHAKEMEHAECYVIESLTHSAYIDGSRISNVETKIDSGMSVRVAKNNKLGRACVTLNNKDPTEKCVRSAIRVSSFSPKNNMFKGYPLPSRPSVKADVFDKKINDIDEKELKSILSSVIGACKAEIPRGSVRLSTIRSVVANSNGLLTEHESTMVYAHFTSMFRGKRNGEGTGSVHGAFLNIDAEHIGEELERKAKASASAIPFKGKETLTMILPPCELGDMIMSSAGSALNGENVFYKRSPWTDMVGKKVASDILTLTDDPNVPGPLCSAFDDEGTPSQKKVLIENGILNGYINDSFIGNSTGNGMRRNSEDAQNIYSSGVTIKPMNMIVRSGRCSCDDMIEQTKNGILVEKFAWPEADPLTGRFGLEVRCGHIIRNGKITDTINNALLMGNMFDALAHIEFIGNDAVNQGCITTPTMSFSGVKLAGN